MAAKTNITRWQHSTVKTLYFFLKPILLILREFHIMHPSPNHLLISSDLPSILATSPPKDNLKN